MKGFVFKIKGSWFMKMSETDKNKITKQSTINWLENNIRMPNRDTEVEFSNRHDLEDIKLVNAHASGKNQNESWRSNPGIRESNSVKFARAPYNFIPLNESVKIQSQSCDHDKFHEDRYSGYLTISIKNLTPLFLRQVSDSQDSFGYGSKYGIPGSSFRGMIRTLCEFWENGKSR
ncbi:MAG TPA: hypothetical protein PKD85_24025 [Saprospiraceae bacterium]|nr:hypothetical protein [Saprospiraceae bacterium]